VAGARRGKDDRKQNTLAPLQRQGQRGGGATGILQEATGCEKFLTQKTVFFIKGKLMVFFLSVDKEITINSCG
jgi:hypothetical protein